MITEEQRRARHHGIGGSDAAAVMGASPYATPLQLWQQKTGRADPPDLSDSEPVAWGNVLEDVVAREYARRQGIKLARVNRTLHHRDHPHMIGHIDRRVVGKPEIVEIKTVRGLGDEPRPDHVWQVRHYMAVLNMHCAHIVYLVAGQTLKHYRIERDGHLEIALIEAERRFWHHVEADTPPPVQSALDARLKHPESQDATAVADDAVMQAVERLRALQADEKRVKAEIDAAQAVVMDRMGEAAVLQDPAGQTLATWKTAKPTRTLDRKRLEAEQPEIAARYISERPGSRRFVLKASQGGAA